MKLKTINFLIITISACVIVFLYSSLSNKETVKIPEKSTVGKLSKTKESTIVKEEGFRDLEIERRFGHNSAQGLDPLIAELTGFGESKDFFKRNLEVTKLKDIELDEQNRRALYSFLRESPPTSGAHLELHSLKNDIINHLIFELKPDLELGRVLAGIIVDKKQHQVMREYAAQFVLNYFEQAWPKGSSQELSEQEAILKEELKEALWTLTELRQGSMAGTAISKLHEISVNHTDIDKEKVAERAYQIASDAVTQVASRMGSLDILAKYPSQKARESIKSIALDEAQNPSMRMVAIASYSKIRRDDSEFNESLRKILSAKDTEVDIRLKWAAEGALKKIKTSL